MQAKEMTFGPRLEGQKQYLVPLYQRTYAWRPVPSTSKGPAPRDQWRVLRQVGASLSEGTWTAHGDIAAVSSIHPKPLGNYLTTTPAPNAWRVLRADGALAPERRWSDPGRTDSPRDVLTAEGVTFCGKGRAVASQRLSPRELAAPFGLDVGIERLADGGLDAAIEAHPWFLAQFPTMNGTS